MDSFRSHPREARSRRTALRSTLIGGSLTAACLVGQAYAQDVDGPVIVLPTVDVETTAVPAAAPRAAASPRRAAAPAAPLTCTPELAGTPICAPQEAAEAAAEQARAAAAYAEAKASAGSNPNADPDAPFKADGLTNSKLSGPVADTPRTITAVTQEVIEATGTTSIRQLARSTPGISLGFGEGGNSFGDNIYVRGFKANNDVYVDGVRDPGTSIHETFNTEQVEVIKGPAGSVGGRGTTGGTLNIASKKPQDVDFYEFTTKLTSAGTKRQTVDLNWGENERLQFRLNGMLQDGATAGRDEAYDDRSGVSAAVRYEVAPNVTFEGDISHTQIEQMPDWGVPFINGEDVGLANAPVPEFGVDPSTFYGMVGRDFQETEQTVATGRVIWDITPEMTLTNTLRGSTSINDYILTAPSSVYDNGSTDPNDWTVGLSSKSWYQETDVLSNDLELAGKSNWGGVEHDWVVGVGLSREDINKTSYINTTSEDYEPPAGARGCTVDVVNPDPSACWAGVQPERSDVFTKTKIETKSIYALDTVTLSEQWIVNGGLRVDHYDISRDQTNRGSGLPETLSRNDTMLNGNIGVTWKPRKELSFYGAAATSTNPMGQEVAAGGSFYGGLDAGGATLSPERNTSYELGVKYEYNDHLLLTAALFQTTKDKAREDIGPRGASVTQDTLKYRVQGVELGVAGKLNDRIGLFGGAVFMDSEILDSADADSIGKSMANMTNEQFNLLATYDVSDALMVGLQSNFVGERDLGTTAANDNKLPSYWSFDLVGSYEISDTTSVRFGVDNVADVTAYDTAYRSGEPFTYVAPGREVWVSLEMKF
ncbi:MAG: catecholate siderophore receptor [Celeribacter sp.]|jgi:catecholate siderophore receptor